MLGVSVSGVYMVLCAKTPPVGGCFFFLVFNVVYIFSMYNQKVLLEESWGRQRFESLIVISHSTKSTSRVILVPNFIHV